MTLSPLYKLLQKKTNWQWGTEQQEAFTKAKQSLTSDCSLVHYDPDKELVLACDASTYCNSSFTHDRALWFAGGDRSKTVL